MAKTLIGLDIGSHSLKVVELRKTRNELILLSCGIKSIPRDTLIDEQHGLLRELFREAGVSGVKVKTSVSGKDIIIRYDVFPAMTKAALTHSLKFEHEKYIPFPLLECVVDIDIIGKRSDGTMNALIVSAKKAYIDERVKLIKKSGLLPQLITTDAMALHQSFIESPFFSRENSCVILNLGYVVTNLIIVKNGEIIFSRDINIGGDNFNRSLADNLGIPLDEAEKTKQEAKDSSIINSLSIDLNSLISEIELSVAYSRKNHDLTNIECVYISGGSSKLKGLTEILGNALDLKIDFWNPFIKLKKDREFKILEEYYHDLILALGIALS